MSMRDGPHITQPAKLCASLEASAALGLALIRDALDHERVADEMSRPQSISVCRSSTSFPIALSRMAMTRCWPIDFTLPREPAIRITLEPVVRNCE